MTDRNILSQTDRRTGMTVPDGYFEKFNENMIAMLPEQPWEQDPTPHVMKRSFWQRIRPYAYMAAMFAGIWLMMNMSSFFAPQLKGNSFAEPSAPLAQLVSQSPDSYLDDYAMNYYDDADLMDDLYASGFDPSSIH